MGTYLRIKAKGITPAQANGLWVSEFPEEEEEKDYPQNYYHDPQGTTLHFYTRADLLADAKWARDEVMRVDLGFLPTMSNKEAMENFRKVFPAWSIIGQAEIKLSGDHYCHHKLSRVKAFIDKYPKLFTTKDYSDLEEYIGYQGGPDTSSYCGECKKKLEANQQIAA